MSILQSLARIDRNPRGNVRASKESSVTAGGTRELTPAQLTAIHTAMTQFVEDDLAMGVPAWESEYCPACDEARPLPGFVLYDRASASAFVCNRCATEYEIERLQGLAPDIHAFVRGRTNAAATDAQPASAAKPSRQAQPADTHGLMRQWDDDLADLDAVDIASALSFPASDPPAYSSPA